MANVEMQSGGRSGGGGRGGRRGGGAMDASVSNSAAGGQLRPGGGGGMPDALPPTPDVAVRWESAKPMQEAGALEEAPLSKQIGKLSEQFYVVSVAGMPMMTGGGRPDQTPEQRAQAIQQRLKQATALKRKGKPDAAPDQVGMVRGPKGPVLVFLFSREAGISAGDKEVIFESAAGAMKVKSKFTLKDMVYKGELAL